MAAEFPFQNERNTGCCANRRRSSCSSTTHSVQYIQESCACLNSSGFFPLQGKKKKKSGFSFLYVLELTTYTGCSNRMSSASLQVCCLFKKKNQNNKKNKGNSPFYKLINTCLRWMKARCGVLWICLHVNV